MINVHASLLPRYRGAAPVHRAVIAGETETGVTIMRVVKALDAGPMLATERRPIGPDETSDEVERDLAQLGARAARDGRRSLAAAASPRAAGRSRATYAHRLTKDDGVIDWTRPAVAHPQPDSRPASLAARVHASCAAGGSSCGDRRRASGPKDPADAPIGRPADERSSAAGHDPRGRRRSPARRDRRRHAAHPRDSGRRQAADGRARISGRPSRSRAGGTFLRTGTMIAPARVAAYDILRAVSAGSADLPTAIAAARATLHDDRDRALAAEIATGVQRWRAALDHLIAHFAKRAHRSARSRGRRDPAAQRLPTAPSHARAGVRGRRRCGESDGTGREAQRQRLRQRGAARDLARRASLPLPPRPADPADRDAALDYLSITLSHPRWLAERWLDRSASTPPRRGCGSTTRRRR